ncbi:TetR family transcriptional regulator [Sphingomonas sp. DT-207]|uniref:TetR family transcriptional regulator n=1 Tax=Sphingomonas sp. DT-207 TaxID=3396167 RepID=UPI003F1A2B99
MSAVLLAWEQQGIAGISARALAQSAGLPVSAIYYHFGDLDHLYDAANRAALARAEQWCTQQIDALAPAAALPPDALPSLLAALIDDWTFEHRQLAFAWRECQLMATRNPAHASARASWTGMWRSFWEHICGLCGHADAAELTRAFFDGESFLHLLQWRRALDRACLDETCRGWSQWLSGSLAPEGPWRRTARAEALRTSPGPQQLFGVAQQIASAAAEIVAQQGVARLTHRAVAARAGVTLGVVSYNFRTSADLLNAAFEAIYQWLVPPTTEERPSILDQDADSLRASLRSSPPEQRAWMLALEELMLAVARDPERRTFAAQLRYLRGRTSGRVLSILLGDRSVSPLDAALFSSFSLGIERPIAEPSQSSGAEMPDTSIDTLLDRLAGG